MIQLFMNGGVSQMDTFDHKPELERSRGDYFRVPGGTGYGVRLIAELGRMLA